MIGTTTGSVYGTNSGQTDVIFAIYNNWGSIEHSLQFGSSGNDVATAVVSGGSSHYSFMVGYTNGIIDTSNSGGYDCFWRIYDAFWSQFDITGQKGTYMNEYCRSAVLDQWENLYIVGDRDYYGSNGDVFVYKVNINQGTYSYVTEFSHSFSGDERAYGIFFDQSLQW